MIVLSQEKRANVLIHLNKRNDLDITKLKIFAFKRKTDFDELRNTI